MGSAREPPPVKVVVALLAARQGLLSDAGEAIEATLGEIELRSEVSAWSWSGYYAAEMGDPLWRQFVALATPRPSADLVALKESTNDLERRWDAGGRRVNLDPGYVDVDKLVLASTKAAAHRIHLGRGIHAECALRFEDGRFQPWSYTYPDYHAPAALAFFTRVRRRLKQQRRQAVGRDRHGR
jgi:hypothetical protein